MNNNELTFAQEFLKQHFDRIVEWSVGDIKKCCRMRPDGTCEDSGALVGAFILWLCAIEYFGGLYTGNPSSGGTKSRMGGFIRTYMNKYDSDKLYDLRWSLVHYYSPHHFVLYHENNLSANIERHLSSSNRGILLHLGCSIRDLEGAVTRYRKDLESDDSLKMKAWKYYKKQYPIMPIKVEEIFSVNTAGGSFNQLTSLSTSGTVSPESWINPTS